MRQEEFKMERTGLVEIGHIIILGNIPDNGKEITQDTTNQG